MSARATTNVAGVIGSPVRHSLSPIIHNAAFRHHGDDWVYVAFDIGDADARVAIDAVRVLGVTTLSVTMPYKERVIDSLDGHMGLIATDPGYLPQVEANLRELLAREA